MIAERTAWDIQTKGVNRSRDVFLDEVNAKTTMTRLSGRALCDQRAVDHVPDGRWSSTSLLAGIDWNGAGPYMTDSGGTEVPTMLAFVEQLLAPVLKPDHIVVMDNLNSHKHAEVVAAIEATGAQVWFLPRHSPDLNSTEKMWSKVKARPRKVAARTTSALITAIGEALDTVTPNDTQNWFKHCGYPEPHTDR